MTKREFAIVLWEATGATGRRTAHHLARRCRECGLALAIGGRNQVGRRATQSSKVCRRATWNRSIQPEARFARCAGLWFRRSEDRWYVPSFSYLAVHYAPDNNGICCHR